MSVIYMYLCSEWMPVEKGQFCDVGEKIYCAMSVAVSFCVCFFHLAETVGVELLWRGSPIAGPLVLLLFQSLPPLFVYVFQQKYEDFFMHVYPKECISWLLVLFASIWEILWQDTVPTHPVNSDLGKRSTAVALFFHFPNDLFLNILSCF